jgi:hypothetical protein
MKFKYFNDTGRTINIHPATTVHGCIVDDSPIKHLEVRDFKLPEGTYPWIKMWDHGEIGLEILVSPQID